MSIKILTLVTVAALAVLPACSKANTPQLKTDSVQVAKTPVESKMQVTHISAVQAGGMLGARPNITVIDVRTPGEFAQGHIKDAINIDFKNANFAENLRALDKSKRYLIHCRSGARSTRSLAVFEQEQFTRIVHMDGGMNAWVKAGLPVAK